VPSVRDIVVGNEPNLNRFWLPQYGASGEDVAAPAFEALLAQTYDALKAVSPAIRVWGCGCARAGSDRPGTSRDTHSPVAFITDLGNAYKTSGRTTPIMDGLAYHPYMENSSIQPTFVHSDTSTTITIADYGRLVTVLGNAFDGTAQPGSNLPILYDEFGVETQITPEKAKYYTGVEPATIHPVPDATQASYYVSAIKLAYCQPTVAGFDIFLFEDERQLTGWQSGLYTVDAKPRASLGAVRWAIKRVRSGVWPC
jgi:hypothetical protein